MNEYLETEREIKGYVEIQYGKILKNRPIGISYTFLPQAPISYKENMFNQYSDEKISQNYASLENNYFLLDGSFVLPYKPNDKETYYNTNSGYISNEIMEEYPLYIDYYQSEEKESIRGMTLYFKDNIPRNITLNASVYNSDKTFNFILENNEKSVVEFDFGDNYIIENMHFRFNNMEYEDRRLRISYVDFGLSDILSKENGNLTKFDIIENMGEFNLEIPSNECVVELYDEERKFDLNNPRGYANLLNEKVIIKPYIGIVTKESGIVYTNNGTFILNNWSAEKNNITLNCLDYIQKIKNTISNLRPLKVSNTGMLDTWYGLMSAQSQFNKQISGVETEDYEIIINNMDDLSEGRLGSEYFDDSYIETTNILDYLRELGIWSGYQVLCRKDKIILVSYDDYNRYVNILKLNGPLLNEPKYNLREKIKSISIKKYLTKDDTTTSIKNYNNDGINIEIDDKFFKEWQKTGDNDFARTLDEQCEIIFNKIYSNYKPYNISFEYIGDPNIIPNMIVPIETHYGEKGVIVLKHKLTYNGGLTGTIEGVGD